VHVSCPTVCQAAQRSVPLRTVGDALVDGCMSSESVQKVFYDESGENVAVSSSRMTAPSHVAAVELQLGNIDPYLCAKLKQ
jgi:hypothetical protein